MAFSLGEYQDIFLEEADDQLQELNRSLLDMEQNPDDQDTINNIFRAAHSLKSSAAFVGLNDLSELAHKMENLLQGVRDKTMKITPDVIDLLFKCFDHINSVIELVSEGEEPTVDLKDIIAQITAMHEERNSAQKEEAVSPQAASESIEPRKDLPKTTFATNEKRHLKRGLDEGLACYELTIYIEPDAPMKWVKAQLILNNVKNIAQIVKTIPDEENLTDEAIKDVLKLIILTDEELRDVRNACDVDLVTRIDVLKIELIKKDKKFVLKFGALETLSDVQEESAPVEQQQDDEALDAVQTASEALNVPEFTEEDPGEEEVLHDKKGASSRRNAPVLRTVKVSVDKLDDLLNNVGELVIANSGFFSMYEDIKKINLGKSFANEFKNRIEQMARIAKDLQSGIMKTRMVPIGQVFSRFHRLIRDVSKASGKNVQLVTRGEDTELDKKVIDVIGEPLMHMVRNSVDHGVETPDERLKLKKNEVATVTLSAHQGGNQIFVEVIDDGQGLNVSSIREKAIEKGLVTPDQAATMEDNEIFNFIFHPGFSTAKKVTDVSGRGVGMNVVKEVVQEMGGNITIESELGMGTRFIMSFPLTLAIIPAIMVRIAGESYAIPLTDVIETINIDNKDVTTIEGHEVINLRGEILSLVRLSHFVGLPSQYKSETDIPVIVVGYSNRKIGLIVDELEGKYEIVIKSLETNYRTVEGLAGASILGDGSIALILDVASMINRVISEQEKMSQEEKQQLLRQQELEFQELQTERLELEKTRLEEERIGEFEAEDEFDFSILDKQSKKQNKVEELPASSMLTLKESATETVSEKSVAEAEETALDVKEEQEGAAKESTKEAEELKELPDLEVIGDEAETQDEAEPAQVQSLDESANEPEGEDIAVVDDKSEPEDKAASEEIDEVVIVSPISKEEPAEKPSEPEESQTEDITESLEPIIVEETTSLQSSDIYKDETQPITGGELGEADDEVKKALHDFRDELHRNVKSALKDGDPEEHIKKALALKEEDLDKIKLLANVGITQAADSLSKIINKRIDMSIPDIRLIPTGKIASIVAPKDEVFIAVNMQIVGDVVGHVLLSIPESSGFGLIDDLYNVENGQTKTLDEDGTSALKEITNIVGSSVINAFSERTGLSILSKVPSIIHAQMNKVMEELSTKFSLESDYALTMDTEFYYEDDRVMGHLLVIPESSTLRSLVDNLRNNG